MFRWDRIPGSLLSHDWLEHSPEQLASLDHIVEVTEAAEGLLTKSGDSAM